MIKKIFTLEKLSTIISSKKQKHKKIVLCHGVFDLLHVGHLTHFNEAKKHGDVLVVTITPDKHVNKGPGRPAFNQDLRARALSELTVVDYIAINSTHSAVNVIKKIKPNVYCKGPDYKILESDITKEIKNETKEVKKYRGKTVFTSGKIFSSSRLINNYRDTSEAGKQDILTKKIKKNYSFQKIKSIFNEIKKLKILIIGELIIDKYVFCEALGKSGKEPVLTMRDKNSEEYLGGSAGIARHVSNFSDNITLFSMIGEKAEYLGKIKSSLPKKIKLEFFKKRNSPTILKTRFVETSSFNKVLGIYKINDEIIKKDQEKKQYKKLKKIISDFDLVIVSDYGHGFITESLAELICSKSKFLALNAQINSTNIGYHSMRNYKKADCVVINQGELENELRDRSKDLVSLIKQLSLRNKIKSLVVTQGRRGAILYDKKSNKIHKSSALASKVIDKVGAGDAFLSIISLFLKLNVQKDLSLLAGSLAAAQSTEDIGNKNAVNKTILLKSIEHILK